MHPSRRARNARDSRTVTFVSDAKPINWSMVGAIAALFLLPAAAIGLQWKKFRYGIDSSESTVKASAIEKGDAKLARNVTVTDAAADMHHTVTWILLEDGSEKERYYLVPLRSQSSKHEHGPVKIVITSDDQNVQESGSYHGIVRDLDGDGVSSSIAKKFEEEGIEIDDKAIMIDVSTTSTGELLGVLYIVGLAFVAPLAAIIGIIAFHRKEKGDASREVKIKQLRQNVPADLKALEDALERELSPFAQITHGDSFYVYSFTAVGPFKVTLHLDDQDRDAPPEVFALVQRIHECYRGHGIKVEGVHYFVEKRGEGGAWRMRATAR
jgi:hypothetical protein